jgi:integrase
MHSSRMLREGARPEVVRDILGHANIDVTQNVYGKSCSGNISCRCISVARSSHSGRFGK